jgi:hypothetical protein
VPAVAIPSARNTRLRRRALARALSAAGFPMTEATLATRAVRGGGPPFQRWGRIPIYTWGTSLDWAESRLSAPVGSTSEADAAMPRVGATQHSGGDLSRTEGEPPPAKRRNRPRAHDDEITPAAG